MKLAKAMVISVGGTTELKKGCTFGLPMAGVVDDLLERGAELDHLILRQEITLREKKDSGKRISLVELDEKYGLAG